MILNPLWEDKTPPDPDFIARLEELEYK